MLAGGRRAGGPWRSGRLGRSRYGGSVTALRMGERMSYYGSDQPGEPWQGAGGYSGADPYGGADGQWVPEPKQGSKGLVAILAAVLVLVLCGGGVAALYLIGAGSGTSSAGGSPTSHPTSGPSGGATATASYDPTGIRENQCVVNDGTDNDPRMRVVTCAPGTYLVLKRLDGTSDQDQCKQVKGSTHTYWYKTTPESQDFVLCLTKKQ
jgi:hypothetical protein